MSPSGREIEALFDVKPLDPSEQAILDSFLHHVPSPDQGERIGWLRTRFRSLAGVIMQHVRPSADRTAALRQLHEAMMTANKAIALEPAAPALPAQLPPAASEP
jgi:hypothetical protein